MKVGLISDLHIDLNEQYPVLEQLADLANQSGIKVLVIAGDLSENPALTLDAAKRLDAMLDGKLYYVPGNHDMWRKNCPERETESIYADFLADDKCLCGKHVILHCDRGDVALVGDIGWYDYTFADERFSIEALETMQHAGRTWQDKLFNQWTDDNRGQLQKMCDRLEAQMKAAGDLPILAVTHMLPIPEFCVPGEGIWPYFNAFLGGSALEELYRNYSVRYAVCGHVHYRASIFRDGIRHICPCLGYYNEWPLYGLKDNEPMTHLTDSLQILDL